MANLKEIRTRIASVKNTQKITKAMYLVAAARLRRAQEAITNMRPYALSTMEMMDSLSARVGNDESIHPLLQKREINKVLLVVLTSDRGLAGGFNANMQRAAMKLHTKLIDEGKQVTVMGIGKKGAEFFTRRGADVDRTYMDTFQDLSYEAAGVIGAALGQQFVDGKVDAVYLGFNEFKSAIQQVIVIDQLLPIEPKATDADTDGDYLYEPDQNTLLGALLPLALHVQVFRALLESSASEHGARMAAMDSATNNAKDMIDALTLQANRARQAAITTELMEIISGAESLKG